MSNNGMPERIKSAISVIAPQLTEVMAVGVAESERRCAGIKHNIHPYLRPSMMRAIVHGELVTRMLPEGWDVVGKSRQNGQILLACPDMSFRFLKENIRLHPGGTPPAGHNIARKAYYRNPLLEANLFSGDEGIPEPIRAIILWDWIDRDDRDRGVTSRVVHTIGEGSWGSAVPCDLSLPVVNETGFYEHLQFDGDDEDVDFFQASISEQENAGA